MHSFLIGIGSNLGDRSRNIARSRAILRASGEEVCVSSMYETQPDGGVADLPFINMVIHYRTALEPLVLLAYLQSIEKALGRIRARRWANRQIDLDILLWRDDSRAMQVVNFPYLKIPHPLMLERDYVLIPASEVAPDWKHPYASVSIHSLAHESIRSTIIRKIYY